MSQSTNRSNRQFSSLFMVVLLLAVAVKPGTAQICETTAAIEILPSVGGAGPVLDVLGGPPTAAGMPRLRIVNVPPGAQGVLAYSAEAKATYSDSIGAVVYTNPARDVFPIQADADGVVALPASLLGLQQCGQTAVFQAGFPDADRPGQWTVSNGLLLTFGTPAASTAPSLQAPPITALTSVRVSGAGSVEGHTIRISGGAAVVAALVGPDLAYSASVPLKPDAKTKLSAVEIDFGQGESSATVAFVVQDSTPPQIVVEQPMDGAVVPSATVSLAGRVSDAAGWIDQITLEVGGVAAALMPSSDMTATFLADGVRLAGSGPQQVELIATDAAGNSSALTVQVSVVEPSGLVLQGLSAGLTTGVVKTVLDEPLQVLVSGASGAPLPGHVVTFDVTRSDGVLSATPGVQEARSLVTTTDSDGIARAWWRLGSDAGLGNQRVRAAVPSGQTVDLIASALTGPATQIAPASGDEQRGASGSVLPLPLGLWASDGRNGSSDQPITFSVEQGGGALSVGASVATEVVQTHTDASGHAAVSWHLGDSRGPQLVRAHLDGVEDVFFRAWAVEQEFETARWSGLVTDPGFLGIEGVVITLNTSDGAEFTTQTGPAGTFVITDITTSGPAHLDVDGSTALALGGAAVPAGVAFPHLEFEVDVIARAENALPRPISLPRISAVPSVTYDGSSSVVIPFPDVVDARMVVAAGTQATHPDGSPVTAEHPLPLCISQVPVFDIPMRPPNGVSPFSAWTLQPGGARFDPPLRVEFPNLSGEAPGTVLDILSFDHAQGRFLVAARGTVSEDGAQLVSDPGQGLGTAGWHFPAPPSDPPLPPFVTPEPCASLPTAPGLIESVSVLTALAREEILAARVEIESVSLWLGTVQAVAYVATAEVCLLCYKSGSPGGLLCDGCLEGLDAASDLGEGVVEASIRYQSAASLLASAIGRLELLRTTLADLSALGPQCEVPRLVQQAKQDAVDAALASAFKLRDKLSLAYLANFQTIFVNVFVDVIFELKATLASLLEEQAGDPLEDLGELVALYESLLPEFLLLLDQMKQEGLDLEGLADEAVDAVLTATNLATNSSCAYLFAGQAAIPTVAGDFFIPNVNATDAPTRLTGICATADGVLYIRSGVFAFGGGVVSLGELEVSPTPFPEVVELEIGTGSPQPMLIIPPNPGTSSLVATATLSDGTATAITGPVDGGIFDSTSPEMFPVFGGGSGVAALVPNAVGSVSVRVDGVTASTGVSSTLAGDGWGVDVSGLVVTPSGIPVAGALVESSGGVIDLTGATGGFFMFCHPQGQLFLSASVEVDGTSLTGWTGLLGGGASCPSKFHGTSAGTIVVDKDTDGDGLPDWYETTLYGSSPVAMDTDGDGLNDGDEVLLLGTSPAKADSDGDGLDDGDELALGTDPSGLTPTTSLVGTVVDGSGTPVEGADVLPATAPDSSFGVSTNVTGSFTIEYWPALGLVGVTVSKDALTGLSFQVPSVSGGVTDLGQIVITEPTLARLFPGPAHAIEVGSFSIPSFATADLNGDGLLDAVVSPNDLVTFPARVTPLLGRPQGHWDAGPPVVASGFRMQVGLGDFTQDGVPDLILADGGIINTLEVFAGDGDGGFAPVSAFFSAGAEALLIGDLDTDGVPDLILSNASTLEVYREFDPIGFFGVHESYPLPAVTPFEFTTLTLSDLDQDGLLDVVVARRGRAIGLLGTGGGVLASSIELVTDLNSGVASVGEFTSDGIPDLVAAEAGGPFRVWPGLGDATFGTPVESPITEGLGSTTTTIGVGDLDADGADDLVARLNVSVNGTGTQHHATALGAGDGTLTSAGLAEGVVSTSLILPAAQLGDIDQDGFGDLLHTEISSGSVVTVAHFGAESGSVESGTLEPVAFFGDDGRAGDVDGDGVDDLVVQSSSGQFQILVGGPSGLAPVSTAQSLSSTVVSFELADYDGDDVLDLLAATSDGLEVHQGLGNAAFAAPVLLLDSSLSAFDIGDLDGDGRPDIAGQSLVDGGAVFWLQQDDGTLAGPSLLPACGAGEAGGGLLIADLNGDMNRDIVFGSPPSACVVLGDGSGGFTPAGLLPSQSGGSPALEMQVGDFTGDGSVDLAVRSEGDELRVHQFTGQGTVFNTILLREGPGSASGSSLALASADVDGDGYPDLVSLGEGVFDVWAGVGAVVTQTSRTYYDGSRGLATWLAPGDFDGDMDVDLVIAPTGLAAVYVAPNLLQR